MECGFFRPTLGPGIALLWGTFWEMFMQTKQALSWAFLALRIRNILELDGP